MSSEHTDPLKYCAMLLSQQLIPTRLPVNVWLRESGIIPNTRKDIHIQEC